MKMHTVFGEIEVQGHGDSVCYSPLLLEKIRYAKSKAKSAAEASEMLRVLAGIEVPPGDIERLA